jgi:uncharacterized OsmC-like protein
MSDEKGNKGEILNNIVLSKIRETKKRSEDGKGHFPVEKVIKGEFHLEGSPMFTAELKSDAASFMEGVDEPSVLGGRGIYSTPLSHLLFGVMSCFASTVALQCAVRGIELGKLSVTGTLKYDIGPMLTEYTFPLINELQMKVEADRDISDIVEVSREKCPALYAIAHTVKNSVTSSVVR